MGDKEFFFFFKKRVIKNSDITLSQKLNKLIKYSDFNNFTIILLTLITTLASCNTYYTVNIYIV